MFDNQYGQISTTLKGHDMIALTKFQEQAISSLLQLYSCNTENREAVRISITFILAGKKQDRQIDITLFN